MTTVAPPPAPADAASVRAPHQGPATVGRHLAPMHARWLAEVSRHVIPACDPRSGFWFRWGAVRYLADRFDRDYGLEVELLVALSGEVEPGAAQRLTEARRALETLRRDLNRTARRRGTAAATAMIAAGFIQALRRWCLELERAMWFVPLEDAPRRAAGLLARLDRISVVREDW